jgi:hypothetical protein
VMSHGGARKADPHAAAEVRACVRGRCTFGATRRAMLQRGAPCYNAAVRLRRCRVAARRCGRSAHCCSARARWSMCAISRGEPQRVCVFEACVPVWTGVRVGWGGWYERM